MWPFKKVEDKKEVDRRTILIVYGYQRVKTYVCLDDMYREKLSDSQMAEVKKWWINHPEESAKKLFQYIDNPKYEVKESEEQ